MPSNKRSDRSSIDSYRHSFATSWVIVISTIFLTIVPFIVMECSAKPLRSSKINNLTAFIKHDSLQIRTLPVYRASCLRNQRSHNGKRWDGPGVKDLRRLPIQSFTGLVHLLAIAPCIIHHSSYK